MNSEKSLQNLRPFNTLTPEQRSEIARLGGIASGERRREIADLKYTVKEMLIVQSLVGETREEYRAAIKRYAREERAKRRRAEQRANRKRSGEKSRKKE